MMPRTYYSVNIYRAGYNSSGIRYTAVTTYGMALRADTLVGMRELIRHYERNAR